MNGEKITLAQRAADLYTDEGLNCSEAMLKASGLQYDLHVDPSDIRLASGLGGGMQIKSVCGALSGAIMASGKLFINERAHESEILKAVVPDFLAEFERLYGSIDCEPLREQFHTEEQGCRQTVALAAEVFARIVDEYSDAVITDRGV